MTPLQKIAMGLVIVLVPASFPRDPTPYWRFYDAVADPVGWVLVLLGVVALGRSTDLDLDVARWFAVVALVVSVPLWFPQVSHFLLPHQGAGPEPTDLEVTPYQWFVSLPHAGFCLFLARSVGRAALRQAPPDRYAAGRFGTLSWGFVAAVVLPAVAFGGGLRGLQAPSLLLLALGDIAFVYYLFRVHRRTWLGGPGPFVPAAAGGPTARGNGPGTTKAAPDEPGRPA